MYLFNPERFYPSDEFLEAYERALMDLDDQDLTVWLYHRMGHGQRDIARRMEVSQAAISKKLRRISLILRSEVLKVINEKSDVIVIPGAGKIAR